MSTATTEVRVTPERDGKKNSRVRDAAGRFVVGTAPGPGAPPKDPDLRAACRMRTMSDLERLDGIIARSRDQWLVLEAIKLRLSYGHGKPVTTHMGAVAIGMLGDPDARAEQIKARLGELPDDHVFAAQVYAETVGGRLDPAVLASAYRARHAHDDDPHAVIDGEVAEPSASRGTRPGCAREAIDVDAAAPAPVSTAPPPAAPDEATATLSSEDVTMQALPPDLQAARDAWHAERARGER